LLNKGVDSVHPENVKLIRRAINILSETSKKLHGRNEELPKVSATSPGKLAAEATLDSHLLKEQLEFVTKVSTDIAKVTDVILE
jgi:hypothetical protein